VNVQDFAVSPFGTSLWLTLGRLPPRVGHAVGRWVSHQLYLRKQAFAYRTIYANQSVVLGPAATRDEVDAAVEAVLRHAGMSQFDVVRAIAGGAKRIVGSVELGEELWPHLHAAQATGRGIFLCGAHLSAFNLGFLSFALCGDVPVQVLSSARTEGGFRIISELRNRGTLIETPIDATALRQAVRRLRDGGLALIGVDWPMAAEQQAERVSFFGRPACLSTGYIRMAISANAVLLPLACRWSPGRGYHVIAAPHLDLELTGDREFDVEHNARRVLRVIEDWIRETPDQWLMYYRVWPDIS
jgi:lauroyl/myristoyl acyltransferase